jgi:Holliday junction resolvase RusA-like endonuclease
MIPSEEFIDCGMKLVFQITISGIKPVPWKAPSSKSGIKKTTGAPYRIHYKDARLERFQEIVKETCLNGFRHNVHRPLRGPIHLEITIRRATKDQSLWGEWAFLDKEDSAKGFGDLRNITKAVEDAIQGILIHRDSQVCSTRDLSHWDENDSITIRIYSLNLIKD